LESPQREKQSFEDELLNSKLAVHHDHDYCSPDALVLLQRLKKAKEDIEILKKKLAAERKKTSFQKK